MTVALWCLMVAALLPVLCAGISKWGFRGFDNHRPRMAGSRSSRAGGRRRACGAAELPGKRWRSRARLRC